MDENVRLIELAGEWPERPWNTPPTAASQAEARASLARVKQVQEQVLAQVDALRDEAIGLLREMVRIPSVNPSPGFEADMARYHAGAMKRLGLEVRQIEPYPDRISNWGVWRGNGQDSAPASGQAPGHRTGKAPTLLFQSHLDVVPPGDEADWTHPPFAAVIDGSRMYGRGTKDMKSGMAAALMVPRVLQAAGVQLRGDLMLVAAADEECGGQMGVYPLFQQGWVQADWCVYTENADPDSIVIGYKGWCQIEVTVLGQPIHTARKHLGLNAIAQMAKVIPHLESLTFPGDEPHPVVPGGAVASVNLIRGGIKENSVPGSCTVTVDIRYSPSLTAPQILARVEERLQELAAADTTLKFLPVKPINVARPFACSPDEPIVHCLSAAVESVRGTPPRVEGASPTSDSRFTWLDLGIPVAHYAPGNKTAHAVDEWVDLDEYMRTIKVYCLTALMLLT